MQHKQNPEQGPPEDSVSTLLLCTRKLSPSFLNLLISSVVSLLKVWDLPNLRGQLQEQHRERRQGAGPRVRI